MSADNWSICPKCKDEMGKKLEDSYGKISQDEYQQLLNKTAKYSNDRTLREDYSIFTDENGLFQIIYLCRCDRCGFKYTYKYTEQLKIQPGA